MSEEERSRCQVLAKIRELLFLDRKGDKQSAQTDLTLLRNSIGFLLDTEPVLLGLFIDLEHYCNHTQGITFDQVAAIYNQILKEYKQESPHSQWPEAIPLGV